MGGFEEIWGGLKRIGGFEEDWGVWVVLKRSERYGEIGRIRRDLEEFGGGGEFGDV